MPFFKQIERIVIYMEYVLIIIAKMLDNVLATGKTILIQKGKGVLAAITVTLSQIIFFLVIGQIVSSDSHTKMIIASVAGGVGTFLAISLGDKFSKEKLFVNNILSDDKEAMTELCDYLRAHKIKNLVTDSYTKNWEKTLAVTVFAETKNESKLVDAFIKSSEHKYVRIIN